MDTETGWGAWNRLYREWAKTTRRHVELQAAMRELAALDPALGAEARQTAALLRSRLDVLQRRMRVTMVQTLLRDTATGPSPGSCS